MSYMAATSLDETHDVRLIGAPFDGTVSFRPGSRFGPAAIREVSDGIETHSPVLNRDLEDIRFADSGDLELPPGNKERTLDIIREAISNCIADGPIPFLLGGEHLVSLPAIEAVRAEYPELVIIQLDAHADQREEWLGDQLSHATVMRRTGELIGFDRIRQIGVRSGTRDEYTLMRNKGTLTTFKPEDLDVLREWVGDRPLYLTVDLDVFDPSLLPGTGTPEPGGIGWWDFQRLITELDGCNLVGCDVVELAPQLDASGCSSVLAAKCVREMLLIAARPVQS